MDSHAARRRALFDAAEALHGLVSVKSIANFGITQRQFEALAANNSIERVLPGVYRVIGAPQTLAQVSLASVLSVGGDALLTGTGAARALRISTDLPTSLEVLTGYGSNNRKASLAAPDGHPVEQLGFRVRRTMRLEAVDRIVVDQVPCTTAARTIIELARSLDLDALEARFEQARRLRLISAEHLGRRIEQLGGRGLPGSATIRRLVERQRGLAPTESDLELKLWNLLQPQRFVRRHPAERQHVTRRTDGQVARIDVAWPRWRYGVEAEGWEWHAGRIQWKRDKRRTASLEAAGWRLTFVTWDDVVRHPVETLDRIEAALSERQKLLR